MIISILNLTMVIGLVLVILVGAALAEDCALVFKGTGQDKLIQDIRTCSQDVRSISGWNFFSAYLNPQNCHISARTSQSDFYNKAALQFVECMGQYGWKIEFNSPYFELHF